MAVEEDIQEIKKEIIQSHNLVIKTDNLITNLSSEIRQLQKKQETYERKYLFNSIWSYLIFTVLCFAGVYLGFEAKVDAVRRDKAQVEEQLAKASVQAEELQKKISVRAQQEKAAEHLLRLKREKRDNEALKVAESLDVNRLSPVLGRLVSRETEDLRLKIGQEALEAGKSLLSKGYLKRAEIEFERSIGVSPPDAILAEAHYQRAQLLLKMNQNAKAADDFLAAVAADPQAAYADYALYQAAGSLENSGDVPRALDAYRRLVVQYPSCRWVTPARRRIDKLKMSREAEDKPAAHGAAETPRTVVTPQAPPPAAPPAADPAPADKTTADKPPTEAAAPR